jgi:TonB family protein
MLQSKPTREATANWVGAIYEDKQRRNMVIALLLLLAAITALLIRDYKSGLSSKNNDQAVVADNERLVPAPGPKPVLPAVETTQPAATKPSAKATATYAHKTHFAGKSASARPSATWGSAAPAAQRTSDQSQTHPQASSYPLLTQASAVQGSVLLQAMIAADGRVEEMRVISGPTILVSAARQAVQQWRFKPYLVNGKPVETYARVTVNFTIDVSNTEARYHVNSVTSTPAL